MKDFVRNLAASYLAFWAGWVLRERRPRIIGVTGSVGKTTTKEAIAAVLGQKVARATIGEVGKSAGSLNTEFGLPLTILRYDAAPKHWLGWLWIFVTAPLQTFLLITIETYPTVLVLEYAADRPGDITRLVRLAPPDVAVVTAVGPAHLEKFKSVERVAKEKAALVRHVPPSSFVVLARDNHFVSAMAKETHAEVVKVPGRGLPLSFNIARVIGKKFGLSAKSISQALKEFEGVGGRLQQEEIGKLVIIDDTYNANPLSMELALDTLKEGALPKERRVAFLGEMRELGKQSEHYHISIGKYARERVDLLIGVGPHAHLYNADRWYATSKEAALAASTLIQPGDRVLVKGSRGVTMEEVVHSLRAIARGWHKKGKGSHGKLAN